MNNSGTARAAAMELHSEDRQSLRGEPDPASGLCKTHACEMKICPVAVSDSFYDPNTDHTTPTMPRAAATRLKATCATGMATAWVGVDPPECSRCHDGGMVARCASAIRIRLGSPLLRPGSSITISEGASASPQRSGLSRALDSNPVVSGSSPGWGSFVGVV